jgi:hypothetical protein
MGTSVLNELSSAASCLAMLPEPLQADPDSAGYLCDVDRWAAHSLEHLKVASAMARLVYAELSTLEILLLEVLENPYVSGREVLLDQVAKIRRMV